MDTIVWRSSKWGRTSRSTTDTYCGLTAMKITSDDVTTCKIIEVGGRDAFGYEVRGCKPAHTGSAAGRDAAKLKLCCYTIQVCK